MSKIFHMYNSFRNQLGEGQTLLGKALTSATGVGEGLIREKLRSEITNLVTRLSPIMNLIDPRYDVQKVHEFNKISALPAAGGAMGEGATTTTRNSTISRDATVTLKIIRRKGSVTGFLNDTTEGDLEAMAIEIENHMIQHVNDLCYCTLFGNKNSNTYEYDGWDVAIATYREQEVSAGVVPSSLGFLDDLIANNTRKQGRAHRKAFLMSPEMANLVSQLLTNVRLNQSDGRGLPMIEIGGGWHLESYRGIPIVETTFTRPTGTMGTVTATKGSAGTLDDDTYYFRVAPITYDGEQLASAEANATTDAGAGAGSVTLSFTAYSGALAYMIYGGTTTGAANTTLIKIIPAYAYDANGTIGAAVTSNVITTMTPSTDVPTAMQTQVCKLGSGGVPAEDVYLIDFDRVQGMGEFAYTNKGGDRFKGMVTFKPLAETDDETPFMLKTYGAIVDAYEATSGKHGNLRVE